MQPAPRVKVGKVAEYDFFCIPLPAYQFLKSVVTLDYIVVMAEQGAGSREQGAR